MKRRIKILKTMRKIIERRDEYKNKKERMTQIIKTRDKANMKENKWKEKGLQLDRSREDRQRKIIIINQRS